MFDIEIHETRNATDKERKNFQLACVELKSELSDPACWRELEALWPRLHYTNNKTFREFKNEFLRGATKLGREVDQDMDVYVTFYYSWNSVVGYTRPSTLRTWTNRKFFSRYDLAEIAGHILHEYLHKCGFDHPGTDRKSLVYMFGYMVRDRIKKRLKQSPKSKLLGQ